MKILNNLNISGGFFFLSHKEEKGKGENAEDGQEAGFGENAFDRGISREYDRGRRKGTKKIE